MRYAKVGIAALLGGLLPLLLGVLASPVHAQALSPGDIIVADPDTRVNDQFGAILRINPTTGGQTLISFGGLFVEPLGLALAANGDLLVVDPLAFGGGGGVIRVNPATG